MKGPERGRAIVPVGASPLGSCPLAMLSAAPTAQAVSAQDCSISRDGWDDIQRFRDCIEEHGLDPWSLWVLHNAARRTTQPDHSCVSSCRPARIRTHRTTMGRHPSFYWGAENSDPMVVTHLLGSGADLNARDNDGCTARAAAQSGNGRVVKVLLDRGRRPDRGER